MDSTIRSNLSVGMSLDLAIVRRDALEIALHRSIDHPGRLEGVLT